MTLREYIKILSVAALMMLVTSFHSIKSGITALDSADLPNPDSYYKLVLLQDHSSLSDFGFVARDGAPAGSWSHWSLPHSWSVWQLHRGLTLMGADSRVALLWGGASLTVLCVVLLGMLLATSVARAGTQRAALVCTLMLASSLPLMAYGKFEQITHHIFMLVPLAGAMACLLRVEARVAGAVFGGLLLGLALWISPETMPFVTGLIVVRAAMRLQHSGTAPLWPTGAGLTAAALCGWLLDPPPPSFSMWALDHISLAWLSYAALVTALTVVVDVCVGRGMALRVTLSALVCLAGAAVVTWLLLVPGALAGPVGLIPAELKPLWWDNINELQPADTPLQFVAYFSVPLLGVVAAGHAAWRGRSLWLLALAAMALAYGALGVWHTRMGAAAALAGAFAFGVGISRLRVFADKDEQHFPVAQQVMAFLLSVAGPVQLGITAGLAVLENDERRGVDCPLAPVADALNALPPATVLAPVFSGPELLYRTHHRVISGPYHHNVAGILDNYRAWLDSGTGQAPEIVQRRKIEYVLGCTDYQRQLMAKPPARSLAQQAAAGDVPEWLEPVPWPNGVESNWRLYRVRAPTR